MNTVTLTDGREVPANSQEFLAECRARQKHVDALMAIQHVAQRRAYLSTVEALEGGAAAERVRDAFAVAWARRDRG